MSNEQSKNNAALNALNKLRARLLDLSARNKLLNYRHPKNGCLRLVDVRPNELAEKLKDNIKFSILPVPEPTKDVSGSALQLKESGRSENFRVPTAEEWAKNLGIDTSLDLPMDNGSQHTKSSDSIQTLLYSNELETRLKNLSHLSQTAIQEMGANILYVAFGFLQWYDNDDSNARFAPLYLIPATLTKDTLNPKTSVYEYTLSYSGEDILPNLSLIEKVRVDFGLKMPELDDGMMPEEYFRKVSGLIDDSHPSWKVRRFISLALFNFSKQLMYLDLDNQKWLHQGGLLEHPIVGKLLGASSDTPENEENSDYGFGEEYVIDDLADAHNSYPIVDDADSSQHSALIDAIDGKNLVIHGPPGTGKSQTITNLIAAGMANGKRILFVAEKLAALEVVKTRLENSGLGEFCLELHSHKSQKQKILGEIESRINARNKYRKPQNFEEQTQRIELYRTQLQNHAVRINSVWKNTRKSCHEIFASAARYRQESGLDTKELQEIYPTSNHRDILDAGYLKRTEVEIEQYKTAYNAAVDRTESSETSLMLIAHPWYGVGNKNLHFQDVSKVLEALAFWQGSIASLKSALNEFYSVCCQSCSGLAISEIRSLDSELNFVSETPSNILWDSVGDLRGHTLSLAEKQVDEFREIQNQLMALKTEIGEKELHKALSSSVIREHLQMAIKWLASISEETTAVRSIVLGQKQLKKLNDQLYKLNDAVHLVRQILGEDAGKLLGASISGLQEIADVIDMTSSLASGLWDLKDDSFDNDELDDILPKLASEWAQLQALKTELEPFYDLSRLPSVEELQQWTTVLNAGGPLRWLKSDWRRARNRLMNCAPIGSKVRFGQLWALVNKAENFLTTSRAFISNSKYSTLLGINFKGPNTDVQAMIALRSWYKQVQKKFGTDYGPKSIIGRRLLQLTSEQGRTLRKMSAEGLSQAIRTATGDYTDACWIFERVAPLNDQTKDLFGANGVLVKFLSETEFALNVCSPFMADQSVSIGHLINKVSSVIQVRNAALEWTARDREANFFCKKAGIQLGLTKISDDTLAVADATLRLARGFDRECKNATLRDYFYGNVGPSTINYLASFHARLGASIQSYDSALNSFVSVAQIVLSDWGIDDNSTLEAMQARNAKAEKVPNSLSSWLDYVRAKDNAKTIGFESLVKKVERGEIQIAKIHLAVRAAIFDCLAREILEEDPGLKHFSGPNQDAVRVQFRETDKQLKELQQKRIAWKIDNTCKIPLGVSGARVGELTELSLLKHECSKKRAHIPIRQLINRAGQAILGLKPCFMMGPMSVAQYLEPGKIHFDLIVMDEASQIRPEDALGAIARGSQIVVVGDPKQLPPTNFFQQDRFDEEQYDENDPTAMEVSESILDVSQNIFPARQLRWHYRSEDPRLIAFSNYHFYSGRLILFPSPKTDGDLVAILHTRVPDGCFVDQCNLREADVIAEAVRMHFMQSPQETLGVVAMNAKQRLQIETAIDRLAKDDVAFRANLDAAVLAEQPIFIKNLENVQGDERDVIFISMTYGPPEPKGRVRQAFGPINQEVGWRRLNVLFTRSRKRMNVFSSFGSQDVLIGAQTKRGVQALRDFLAYCETGILHATSVSSDRTPDSDFEIAVKDALLDRGYECVPQVGVAGFFIDIGVRDPKNLGRFLLGIECDGATYHSAKSTRDRDRLRQAILERLGWNIHRIWSTDWFKNPQAEINLVVKKLRELSVAIN